MSDSNKAQAHTTSATSGTRRSQSEDAMAPKMAELHDYAGKLIDDGYLEDGSPHGSGALGRADEAIREAGEYRDIEDAKQAHELQKEIDRLQDAGLTEAHDEIRDLNEALEALRLPQNDSSDADFDAEAADALRGDEAPGDDEGGTEDDFEETETDEGGTEYPALDDSTPVKYRADGEDHEATLAELKQLAAAGHNYTKKVQQVAEERKALDNDIDSIATTAHDYSQRIQLLEEALTRLNAAAPEELGRLSQERAKALSEAQALQAQHFERSKAREREVLIDSWGGEEKAMRAEFTEMSRYLMEDLGYDKATLNQLNDAQAILLIRDGIRYRQGASQREEVLRQVKTKTKKAKTLKPGSRPLGQSTAKAKAKKRIERKRSNLKRTGRTEDAASLMVDTLGDDFFDGI